MAKRSSMGLSASRKKLAISVAVTVVALGIFVIAGNTIRVPHTAMVTFTEKEPYDVQEQYEEQEPYTVTECDDVQVPYTDTECETKDLVWNDDYTVCKGAGLFSQGQVTYTVNNLDAEEGGVFTVWVGFRLQDGNEIGQTGSLYISPQDSADFTYTSSSPDIDRCAGRVQTVPTKTICNDVTKYRTDSQCEDVTKFRTVTKERTVTKYRDVEKEKPETIYKSLFETWFEG